METITIGVTSVFLEKHSLRIVDFPSVSDKMIHRLRFIDTEMGGHGHDF